MTGGKSVRLFLADGTPGGLLTAEIMNWTGHVVAAPRSDLAELLTRDEALRTGIYILLGDDPNSFGGQVAYIGESDAVGKRLSQHARPEEQGGKDFWDRSVILTSKDANLTKAHARYLESRFISLADQSKRAHLANGTAPQPIALPEADVSDMEYFIDQAKIILPVLGVNLFRSAVTAPTVADSTSQRTASPIFELTLKKMNLVATAQVVDGEFTVMEGSIARARRVDAVDHSYSGLRSKLEKDGVLAPTADGSAMCFTRNYVFASPSAAAAVVLGRAANGRKEWVVRGGSQPFGQWETEGVEDAINWMGDE